MNFRAKTLAGAAVLLVALAATGCGSNLANNASGLHRGGDGLVRNNAVERTGRVGRASRNYGYYRGFNRNFTRTSNRRMNTNAGTPNTLTRHGIDRTATQNHYLRQENLTLRDGRHIGNETNRIGETGRVRETRIGENTRNGQPIANNAHGLRNLANNVNNVRHSTVYESNRTRDINHNNELLNRQTEPQRTGRTMVETRGNNVVNNQGITPYLNGDTTIYGNDINTPDGMNVVRPVPRNNIRNTTRAYVR